MNCGRVGLFVGAGGAQPIMRDAAGCRCGGRAARPAPVSCSWTHTMRRPRRNNGLVIALYVNAALLLAILVAVMSGGNGSRFPSVLPAAYAAAPAPQPIAGGGGLYLMPAQFAGNQWGCYIMDVDAQTLAAYRWFDGDKKLRLVAARSFRNDRKLENFNTDNPMPDEVAKLLKLQEAGRRDNPEPNPKPANEPAPGEDGASK